MKYLILPDHRGLPIHSSTKLDNNEFEITVARCDPLRECIVYDDDNGRNHVGQMAHAQSVYPELGGMLRIRLVLTGESVPIDYHLVLDE